MPARRGTRPLIVASAILALLVSIPSGAPSAQQPVGKIVTGVFAFPSLTAPVIHIIDVKGLAKKHGLDLEIKYYSAASAYYTDLLKGEVNVQVVGVPVLGRMRNDGVPVQFISTYATLDSLHVLTRAATIKSVADLRGKTLAADMTSAEYQILAAYAKSKGLDLTRDASVIQAALPLARARLKSGEADAAMLWEPAVTQAMKGDHPDYRSIFPAAQAWREMTSREGWELVYAAREEYARANPEVIKRWLATLQDAKQWIQKNPDEADQIVVERTKLPAGIFKEAVRAGRIVYTVEAAWEPNVRQGLEQMLKTFVDVGYLSKMPPAEIFFKP